MTVPANQNNYIAYTGDGSSTAFSFPFVFYDAADLVVWVDGVVKTLSTDYIVSGGSDATGTVNFVSAPASGAKVFIFGKPVNDQRYSFPLAGPFPSTQVAAAIDRAILLAQRCLSLLAQCIHVPEDDHATALVVPEPAARAGMAVAFDASGNVVMTPVLSPATPNVQTQVPLANNQSSPADVTGLLLDHTTYRSYAVHYDIKRKATAGSTECREVGTLIAIYSVEDGAWTLLQDVATQIKNDPGITFSMNGQQVQYTSTDNGAGDVSSLGYRVAEAMNA